MTVKERAVMPDGTKIQIEDWHENFSIYAEASTIAAYPKDRHGKAFRASRSFESAEVAKCAFENLISGACTLSDYSFTAKSAGRDIPYSEKI